MGFLSFKNKSVKSLRDRAEDVETTRKLLASTREELAGLETKSIELRDSRLGGETIDAAELQKIEHLIMDRGLELRAIEGRLARISSELQSALAAARQERVDRALASQAKVEGGTIAIQREAAVICVDLGHKLVEAGFVEGLPQYVNDGINARPFAYLEALGYALAKARVCLSRLVPTATFEDDTLHARERESQRSAAEKAIGVARSISDEDLIKSS
jgi:hypothetical protein